MNERQLKKNLSELVSSLRYFETIGSTNDEALAWAAQGARDMSIVIADEQTAGRGRFQRRWITPKGTALAFSLILRPSAAERSYPSRSVGLAALSLTSACLKLGLSAQIKWPNDVLLGRRKMAGILIESVWTGEALDAIVVGVGVNVKAESVPPQGQLAFPATSLEDELRKSVSRTDLLQAILSALRAWREKLGLDEFVKSWEDALAFRGEQVWLVKEDETSIVGELLGIETDGSLRLRDAAGNILAIQSGEVHLRPL
jgi:BirA family biotin operon repressor/biotin-[acetyl-CoA-carboxylase] ligase